MSNIGHYNHGDYLTAIHEAAHAFTYCYFKIKCRIDTVNVGKLIEGKAIPDQDYINTNKWKLEDINYAGEKLTKAIKILMAKLAGPIAEKYLNRQNGEGNTPDFVIEKEEDFWSYVKECCFGETQQYLFVSWLIERTTVFIENFFNWEKIKKLAEVVIKNKIVEYSEIKRICRLDE